MFVTRQNVSRGTRWAASVDALTATSEYPLDITKFEQVAEHVGMLSMLAGGTRLQQNWQGYKGWRCGSIFFGVREDGCCIDIKSGLADIAYEQLKDVLLKVSRLDIQITYWTRERTEDVVRRVEAATIENRQDLSKLNQPKMRTMLGHGEGDTLYLGKPGGNKMIRVYDKGRQDTNEEYKGAIRWEVQFRHEKAARAAQRLRTSKSRIDTICGMVQTECRVWGVPAPYLTNTPQDAILVSYQSPDLARKVAWFENQVIAAVEKMGYHPGAEKTMKMLVETIRRNGYITTDKKRA